MKAILYYVYDPMCSWCWGYAPTWQRLESELAPDFEIVYLLGGLAEDSVKPMPEEMQAFLQQTWHKISQQLGTEFNFDFWTKCEPRRSTYPACRAALIARKFGKEPDMLKAIQQAYYLQAKNPSDIDVLKALASEIGLDTDDFLQQISSNEIDIELKQEINTIRAMPVNGFPSLVLAKGKDLTAIPIDYKNWRTSYEAILKKGD